jgi:hypothetical protein
LLYLGNTALQSSSCCTAKECKLLQPSYAAYIHMRLLLALFTCCMLGMRVRSGAASTDVADSWQSPVTNSSYQLACHL